MSRRVTRSSGIELPEVWNLPDLPKAAPAVKNASAPILARYTIKLPQGQRDQDVRALRRAVQQHDEQATAAAPCPQHATETWGGGLGCGGVTGGGGSVGGSGGVHGSNGERWAGPEGSTDESPPASCKRSLEDSANGGNSSPQHIGQERTRKRARLSTENGGGKRVARGTADNKQSGAKATASVATTRTTRRPGVKSTMNLWGLEDLPKTSAAAKKALVAKAAAPRSLASTADGDLSSASMGEGDSGGGSGSSSGSSDGHAATPRPALLDGQSAVGEAEMGSVCSSSDEARGPLGALGILATAAASASYAAWPPAYPW
eukprot:g4267.t1